MAGACMEGSELCGWPAGAAPGIGWVGWGVWPPGMAGFRSESVALALPSQALLFIDLALLLARCR